MADEGLVIPDFLRRINTPEQKARVKRLTARWRSPKLKNPRKRSRRKTGLGPIFGTQIKAT